MKIVKPLFFKEAVGDHYFRAGSKKHAPAEAGVHPVLS